jgi:hypothetical protein
MEVGIRKEGGWVMWVGIFLGDDGKLPAGRTGVSLFLMEEWLYGIVDGVVYCTYRRG